MHKPIEYGIGQRRFADVVVPLFDGELARDEGRFAIVPVIEDLEQIAARVIVEWHESPIVEDKQVGFGLVT